MLVMEKIFNNFFPFDFVSLEDFLRHFDEKFRKSYIINNTYYYNAFFKYFSHKGNKIIKFLSIKKKKTSNFITV